MKKILAIFAALVMAIGVATAQNYEYVGPFGMPYVTVDGGGISHLNAGTFTDFVKGFRPSAGLELGTYFTPVWGASVEGLAHINTTGSYTFVDQSAVLANGKVNLTNLFLGYNGRPWVLDVVGVAGIGWGHDYGEPIVDPNYVVYNTGTEFNFNLGEKRAWQINVRPTVLWNNYDNDPKFHVNDAHVRLTVGLTYKFGNRRVNSHNFVTNNYAVTREDYDALNEKYNNLANRPPVVKVVEKPVVKVEKEIVKETKVLVGSHIITFPIGSCVLSATEKAKVDAFAKSLDGETLIKIVGSADSKTGTETRNFALAKNRANVVKYVLVSEYGISEDRIAVETTLDATDNVLTSRSAIATLSVD